MSFQNRVAEFITLDNAVAYNAVTDKYVWVIDNILDPADVNTTDARVNWIEDQFDIILEQRAS